MIAIFPVVGHAGVAKNEPDQIGEARLGANIVRQHDNTTLTSLDADHSVGGLAIVATFVETMPLRAIENDDTEPLHNLWVPDAETLTVLRQVFATQFALGDVHDVGLGGTERLHPAA